MFLVAANTRQAIVGQKEWLTTGSSGIQVQFLFSDDWDGLSKFAVFRNAEIEESVIPIALPSSNLTELPAENCAAEYVDEKVYVGVYGTDGLGHIIIPTIWVSLGVLKEGASYEGMDPPQPTPDMWAQILAIAQNAGAENAEAAEAAAGRAEEAAELLTDVSATATTLEPENQATANYNNGVFEFGIPKGQKGDPFTYEDLTEEQKAELVQGPILEARDAAVTAVGNARVNAVDAVGSAGTTAVGAVNQAGTTQVGNVNQAGNTQVQAVADKGDEVIGSIPPDYSDLAAEVSDLNRQISDETTGLDTKAPVILETASGAIASFSDGADNMPIKKLVAQIEPMQDLHGYDHPWPGGGNKNLIDYTNLDNWRIAISPTARKKNNPNGVIVLSGDKIKLTSRKSEAIGYSIVIGELDADVTYALSISGSDAGITAAYIALLDGAVSDNYTCTIKFTLNFVTSESRKYVTFVPQDTGVYEVLFWKSGIGDIITSDLQFELGSTATAYVPYSNICPISGHTGAEIEQRGKNLLEPKFYGGLGYNVAVGSKLLTTLTDITNTVTHTGNAYTKSGGSWGIEMNMMLPLDESFVGKRLKFSGSV